MVILFHRRGLFSSKGSDGCVAQPLRYSVAKVLTVQYIAERCMHTPESFFFLTRIWCVHAVHLRTVHGYPDAIDIWCVCVCVRVRVCACVRVCVCVSSIKWTPKDDRLR